MIAYGGEFPEFMTEYLAPVGAAPTFEWNRHREERSDAAIQSHPLSPPSLDRFAYAGDVDDGSAQVHHATASLPDIARLENAWVEAYHAEDASVAAVGALAALNPDRLAETRITFHPAARLLRFATPAATVWASAQVSNRSVAPTEGPGEDALIARPDCDVRVRVLPPGGYDFALKMREGATLIEALTAVDDPAFDFGTHLVGLVESGAVASIIPGQAS
jgi:hypothetical protein